MYIYIYPILYIYTHTRHIYIYIDSYIQIYRYTLYNLYNIYIYVYIYPGISGMIHHFYSRGGDRWWRWWRPRGSRGPDGAECMESVGKQWKTTDLSDVYCKRTEKIWKTSFSKTFYRNLFFFGSTGIYENIHRWWKLDMERFLPSLGMLWRPQPSPLRPREGPYERPGRPWGYHGVSENGPWGTPKSSKILAMIHCCTAISISWYSWSSFIEISTSSIYIYNIHGFGVPNISVLYFFVRKRGIHHPI